jgi:hypothetical protein
VFFGTKFSHLKKKKIWGFWGGSICISSVINLTIFFIFGKKKTLAQIYHITNFFPIKTPDFHKAGRRKINLKKDKYILINTYHQTDLYFWGALFLLILFIY